MYDGCQIRVRIDTEGNTCVTFVEYTENGSEISYTDIELWNSGKGAYGDGREFLQHAD